MARRFATVGQPGPRVTRHAVDLPAFQRIDQSVLQRVLRQRNRQLADQCRMTRPYSSRNVPSICSARLILFD